ncbi:hypothetical protein EUA98_19610 [Pengzhenrongella frigida]|uniref:Mutator family transposase n=1 Tax=Pengzhenrongella frigida TaxID=1259133 RepID=A0A4Q5MUS6_9MICO|nr:hypothetical protein EUA98_19610 [Cellulomonas sp. HLT2-17]
MLEAWEGQPAPRLYGYTARNVAQALSRVARGDSYRGASAAVRSVAGRELDTRPSKTRAGHPLAPANQHGQLVADWTETFAPVIWREYAPTSWPARVAIDSVQFRLTHTRNKVTTKYKFHVLAAFGYDSGGRPYLAAIEAVPRATEHAWRAFLRRMPGEPALVVSDGGQPFAAATQVFTGATEVRRCEWHLAKNVGDNLPEAVRRDASDPLHGLLRRAQRSEEAWETFREALTARSAAKRGFLGAMSMTRRIDPIVRAQILTRTELGPNSTGAVEEFFASTLRPTIAPRAQRMSNKIRADAFLLLLAAQRNGWADETKWTTVIHDHLVKLQGQAPQQRQHTDAAATPSLWS